MADTKTRLGTGEIGKWSRILPFWASVGLIPLAWFCAWSGGWVIAALPLCSWLLFSILDGLLGLDEENLDPAATEHDLYWYRAVTIVWVPLQFLTVFGLIWYTADAPHLSSVERGFLFFGVGILSGTIGINYSHELLHQKNRLERFCADVLLAMVLYSHFRSEHLLVHHRYVGTPKDPVSATYNEGFHRYYPRVLVQSLVSAFRAEKALLHRKALPWTDLSNPFFKYWGLQIAFLLLAVLLGGWTGLILFLIQTGSAIMQLELVNYIEHYGLTRKHLGDGKYEHVQPRHSWNAAHKATNWMLINLQRHSDHHYKPDRRYPVLQTYGTAEAPQLPFGYPIMTLIALVPPLWRRVMNPRVRKWRAMYYPEITDWTAYNERRLPHPK